MDDRKQTTQAKHVWTEQEDKFLRNLVPGKGRVNWTHVMENFNNNFRARTRSAKQCRERYVNYSKFLEDHDQHTKWNPQEFQNLFEQFGKWGPRWNMIAKSIPHKYFLKIVRSGNAIKNKFYGGLRKVIRKMNQVEEAEKGKIKKKVKYESVVRIIEAPECLCHLDAELKDECVQLREKIISLMQKYEQKYDQKEVGDLINRINQFNLITRSYRTKRRRNKVEGSIEDLDAYGSKLVNGGLESGKNSEKDRNDQQGTKMEAGEEEAKRREAGKQITQQLLQVRQNNVLPQSSPTLKEVELPYSSKPQDDFLEMLGDQSSPLEQSDLY